MGLLSNLIYFYVNIRQFKAKLSITAFVKNVGPCPIKVTIFGKNLKNKNETIQLFYKYFPDLTIYRNWQFEKLQDLYQDWI